MVINYVINYFINLRVIYIFPFSHNTESRTPQFMFGL